jgi:hypothetical protein
MPTTPKSVNAQTYQGNFRTSCSNMTIVYGRTTTVNSLTCPEPEQMTKLIGGYAAHAGFSAKRS